jgi:hypothetical protein
LNHFAVLNIQARSIIRVHIDGASNFTSKSTICVCKIMVGAWHGFWQLVELVVEPLVETRLQNAPDQG